MLPAGSTPTSPTGPPSASATRPSATRAIPAGSNGHHDGIAATHSPSAHRRSATGANGRIRHPTPPILPLAPAHHTPLNGHLAAPTATDADVHFEGAAA